MPDTPLVTEWRLFTCLLVALSASIANGFQAQRDGTMDEGRQNVAGPVHPFLRGELWGYIDNSGAVVIEPQFDMARDFFEGRAAVCGANRVGYIRADGSWACTLPRGAFPVGDFHEGRAWFRREDRYGAVDSKGNIVIPIAYDRAKAFSDGLAAVMVRRPATEEESDDAVVEFLDRSGMIEDPQRYVDQWGYVNEAGKLVIPLEYAHAGRFGDGLAPVRRRGSRSYEYVDDAGKSEFSLRSLRLGREQYVGSVHRFTNGRALIDIDGQGPGVPFAVFVDRRGQPVGHNRYDGARPYHEGLAAVTLGNRVGFIDVDGNLLIAPKFKESGDFHEGLCRVRNGDTWQFIDRDGRVAARPTGGKVWNDAEDFHGGLARVHVGGTFEHALDGPSWWEGGAWYYIERLGRVVGLCRHDGREARPFGKEVR